MASNAPSASPAPIGTTDNDHVLDAVQHNTYDIEFHGPNPLSGIYYLAAVRAVEEMARAMGEDDLSARCRQRLRNRQRQP